LIVEGNPGFVVINPPEEVIQEYRRNQEKIGAHRENLEELITSPAETLLISPYYSGWASGNSVWPLLRCLR